MSDSLMKVAELLMQSPPYREGSHARIMEEQRECNPYDIFAKTPIVAHLWYAGWDAADDELKQMSQQEDDEFPTHPLVESNDNG